MLFLAASCDRNGNGNGNDDLLEIMPLGEGYYWKFAETYFALGSLIVDIDTMLITIEKDTVIRGDTTWKWIQTGQEFIMYFKNHDDGLYMHAFSDTASDTLYIYPTPRLMFKYPGEVGEEWAGISLIATDTMISTPVGDFICYGYRDYESPFNRRFFFAPGIGYIGTTTYYYTELNRDRKLVDYFVGD